LFNCISECKENDLEAKHLWMFKMTSHLRFFFSSFFLVQFNRNISIIFIFLSSYFYITSIEPLNIISHMWWQGIFIDMNLCIVITVSVLGFVCLLYVIMREEEEKKENYYSSCWMSWNKNSIFITGEWSIRVEFNREYYQGRYLFFLFNFLRYLSSQKALLF
jgi:hypothetical protein